jgi:hypothetical protein
MDQRGQNSRALIGPGMSGSRVMSRAEAAAYCGCTVVGFSDWVRRGIVPGPIPGTRKWDRKAVDAALDEASQLGFLPTNPQEAADLALQQWIVEHAD